MPRATQTKPLKTKRGRKPVVKSAASAAPVRSSKSLPKFRIAPSYTSLIYGAVTLLVIFALVFAGLRNFSHRQPTEDIGTDGAKTVNLSQAAQSNSNLNTYTVKSGDSLWNIAQQQYHDGYKWTEIAKANNLQAPYSLEAGKKLVIPPAGKEVASAQTVATPTVTAPTMTTAPTRGPTAVPTATPKPLAAAPTMTQQQEQLAAQDTTKGGVLSQQISGSTYTVVHGDYLWEIAVRAYGNGYRWVDIARANNLVNPNIIHSGNVLTIPR